jgi:hypothetical protein
MEHVKERLRYRLICGPDDEDFSRRISAALAEGYELHGSPTLAVMGVHTIVAQALLLPAYASGGPFHAAPAI